MIDDARKQGPFTRLWHVLLEASEVAVAARYHAPWAAPVTAGQSVRNRSGDAARPGREAAAYPDRVCSEAG